MNQSARRYAALGASISICALLYGATAALTLADHSVNINTADKDALVTLTGIGDVKAQAIIDYRTTNGPFANIGDIQDVSGIGPATYEGIKEHITVGGMVNPPSPSPNPSPSPSPGISSPSPSPVSSGGLSVDAGGDRTTLVGADVHFLARTYQDKKIVNNAKFKWNFGDGSTTKGPSPTHRFEYPGRYVVVVTAELYEDSSSDRFVVTVEEVQLVLRLLPDGGIEIENSGGRDVDLSYWSITSGSNHFVLSEYSEILAGHTMRIAPSTLGFSAGSDSELDYPSGALAVSIGQHPLEETIQSTVAAPPPSAVLAPTVDTTSARSEELSSEETSDDVMREEQVAAAGNIISGSWTWWLAALGLAAVSAGGIVVARRLGKGEWTIIEDKEG